MEPYSLTDVLAFAKFIGDNHYKYIGNNMWRFANRFSTWFWNLPIYTTESLYEKYCDFTGIYKY
jgi:hypothetical protein